VSRILPDVVPHRYPFRLVERAESLGDGRIGVVLATGNGTLTRAAPWPCSLVAEAMAQAVLVVAPVGVETPRLVGVDRARLLRPVSAGDRLDVEATEVGSFGSLRKYACRAVSAGALAATAELTVIG